MSATEMSHAERAERLRTVQKEKAAAEVADRRRPTHLVRGKPPFFNVACFEGETVEQAEARLLGLDEESK